MVDGTAHRVRDTDARQERFLKVTANSTSYGVLARFDRRERPTPTTVRVYGPDGEPSLKPVASPEDPGPYCFPPIAASITAAARLMLALLEHHVTAAAGTYASGIEPIVWPWRAHSRARQSETGRVTRRRPAVGVWADRKPSGPSPSVPGYLRVRIAVTLRRPASLSCGCRARRPSKPPASYLGQLSAPYRLRAA
jgi:hypothetical protein